MAEKKSSASGRVVATGLILELYPEHARLIGLLVTQWTATERFLVDVLAKRMGLHWYLVHAMIYEIRNTGTRLDAMKPALLGLYRSSQQEQDEIKAIIAEARHVSAARNKYAHACFGEKDGQVVILDASDPVAWGAERAIPVELQELKLVVEKSAALCRRVLDFLGRTEP